jgi:hypothetical protein
MTGTKEMNVSSTSHTWHESEVTVFFFIYSRTRVKETYLKLLFWACFMHWIFNEIQGLCVEWSSTLKVEAASSSGISVSAYHTIRYQNPEHLNRKIAAVETSKLTSKLNFLNNFYSAVKRGPQHSRLLHDGNVLICVYIVKISQASIYHV